LGIKELGAEGTSFVQREYGKEINDKLTRIANILWNSEVDPELAGELGDLIGDIAGINFIAGIEFGDLRPEAAEKLKNNRIRQHETQPS
jgi:hypothetical protein